MKIVLYSLVFVSSSISLLVYAAEKNKKTETVEHTLCNTGSEKICSCMKKNGTCSCACVSGKHNKNHECPCFKNNVDDCPCATRANT